MLDDMLIYLPDCAYYCTYLNVQYRYVTPPTELLELINYNVLLLSGGYGVSFHSLQFMGRVCESFHMDIVLLHTLGSFLPNTHVGAGG